MAGRIERSGINGLITTLPRAFTAPSGELPVRGYGRVELNLGMHGAHGEESLQTIKDRFGVLREQLEAHLKTGAKVVYLAEAATFTSEQSQRVSDVLRKYPTVTPSDAQQAVLTGVDNRDPQTWSNINSHFYQADYNSFAIHEMNMVDSLALQYPGQFIFMLEGGQAERISKSNQAVEAIKYVIPERVRRGDVVGTASQFKKAVQTLWETQSQRDQKTGQQIGEIIDDI